MEDQLINIAITVLGHKTDSMCFREDFNIIGEGTDFGGQGEEEVKDGLSKRC